MSIGKHASFARKSVVKAILPECLAGVAELGNSAILFKVNDVWHINIIKK
jgi:hypothetical protein